MVMALNRLILLGSVVLGLTYGVALFDSKPDKEGKIWAVLAAGSYSFYNYRHQADVCHAYQVLHQHGVPDENIVVMMYNDIAFAKENPTPGIVINHPDGKDVYAGVPLDYNGEDVTAENFLKILEGDEEAMRNIGSGKVIKSGPNDHVFVYFSDHGAPGIVAFPTGPYLEAEDINNVIKRMHQNKKYGKMAVFFEACEAGSMFDGLLPEDINAYAMTAAGATDDSYACYWDDLRETYLGDLFSVNWLEDTDKEQISRESLEKLFTIVKSLTNESDVTQYGDLDLSEMKVSEFLGRSDSTDRLRPTVRDAILSRDVPVEILKRKIVLASDSNHRETLKKRLARLLQNRDFVNQKMVDIVTKVSGDLNSVQKVLTGRTPLRHRRCYGEALKHFHNTCFNVVENEYVLSQLHVLVNLCEEHFALDAILDAMDATCKHPNFMGII